MQLVRIRALLLPSFVHQAFCGAVEPDEGNGRCEDIPEIGSAMIQRLHSARGVAPLTTTNKTPPVVLLSVFINDIDSVTSSRNEWHGDVVATIRYKESSFPAGSLQLQVYNGHKTAVTEYRKHTENGTVSETTRMKVAMTMQGDFDTFPFDEQSLKIDFILNGLSSNEAVFEQDTNSIEGQTGIHAIDEQTGRRFNEAQFRITGWEIKIESKKSSGVPYEKSHAEMVVFAGRYLPYYFLTCIALPMLPTIFAVNACHLPIDKGYRHTISFISFLTLFVHLKQTMSYVPPGIWCWVMTELAFFSIIISVAIMGNFISSVLVKHRVQFANRHDRVLLCMLPLQVLIGEILLLIFKRQHFLIGMCILVPIVVLHHGVVSTLFWVESQKQHDKEPSAFLNLVSLSFILGPIPAGVSR